MNDRESPLHPGEAQFAGVQIEFAKSQDSLDESVNIRWK
jgi:hypothetical protein